MVWITSAPKASSPSRGTNCKKACRRAPRDRSCSGVSENKLLLDGTPLETGQAERSFAQLLTPPVWPASIFPTRSPRTSSSNWCGLSPWADPGPRMWSRKSRILSETARALRFASTKLGLWPPTRHRRDQHRGSDRGPDSWPGIQAVAQRSTEIAATDRRRRRCEERSSRRRPRQRARGQRSECPRHRLAEARGQPVAAPGLAGLCPCRKKKSSRPFAC